MLVGVASLPHSCPPEHRHFTSQKGKTAYTYETECMLHILQCKPIVSRNSRKIGGGEGMKTKKARRSREINALLATKAAAT